MRTENPRSCGEATSVACGLLAGLVLAGVAVPATAQDWPQLLGPERDGTIPGPALEAWPDTGPPELWSRDVGAGFAGPAVARGRVLLFHRRGSEEVLEAFAAATGETLWRGSTTTRYRDDFGFDDGPRVVPVVAGERVFTVGASGVLTAWALGDGALLWQRDTRSEFDVPKGFFGVATGPLVVGNRLLMNVGGRGAGIVAFEAATGETLWQVADDEQSYASPQRITLGGRPAALFFTREGLVAIDPADGGELLRFAHKTRIRSSVNAAAPVVVGQTVFLSAEYGAGAVLLELPGVIGGAPQTKWQSENALNNHYATSVHRSGVLYGFHGRQERGPDLRAVDHATGEVLWSERRFGAGSVLRSADRLLLLLESGALVLAEASRDAYRELARAQILEGTVRAYPAISGDRLFARGGSTLRAWKLRR